MLQTVEMSYECAGITKLADRPRVDLPLASRTFDYERKELPWRRKKSLESGRSASWPKHYLTTIAFRLNDLAQ